MTMMRAMQTTLSIMLLKMRKMPLPSKEIMLHLISRKRKISPPPKKKK
jgi:hypothetical protein